MAELDKIKLTALKWDSDASPHTFFMWRENMASLVRATLHGDHIQDMLDAKMGLRKPLTQSIPSF